MRQKDYLKLNEKKSAKKTPTVTQPKKYFAFDFSFKLGQIVSWLDTT